MRLFRKSEFLRVIVAFLVTLAPFCVASQEPTSDASAVIRAAGAAVVTIETRGRLSNISVRDETQSSNSLAEELRNQLGRQRRSGAVGSGFIVSRDGYIVTNLHVVAETARITVRLENDEEFAARIVGTDEETDLVVLKIDAGRDLPVLRLGDSDQTRVGDKVFALGSPFGLARTMTAGIVSQINRETPETYEFPKRFIQTDAAINRGNSGGPLLNENGEAIGVNSVIATSTGASNGIGFALPINDAVRVFREIIASGKVRRGYLGVSLESVRREYARVFGLPESKGAIIVGISDPKGPAASAGLQIGDVITDFDGREVVGSSDLIATVAARPPERTYNVTFFRETAGVFEKKTAVVRLAERPTNNRIVDADRPRPLGQRVVRPFGLVLQELTPALIDAYKLGDRKGLLIRELEPSGQAFDLQNSVGEPALVEGDLVTRLNRDAVTDLKTFNSLASKLKRGDAVVLHVLSNNRSGRGLQLKIVQFTMD